MPVRTIERTTRQLITRASVARARADLPGLDPLNQGNIDTLLMPGMSKVHRRQERQLFASEGASGGKPWPQLDPDYKRKKRAAVGNKKILVWDGTLRNDLTIGAAPQFVAEGSVAGNRLRVQLGTTNILAQYHQDGVRRRTDKPQPKSGGTARSSSAGKRTGTTGSSSRRSPTFDGTYIFVKRDALQKTREQTKELGRVILDYLTRQVALTMRAWQGVPKR